MRDFKGMKRQRGRNRKPGSGGGNNNANATNPNRSWDSQGPENIKVRGNAQTVYERYQQLARDAGSAGDRVLAENYMQHAEHYFRVLRALQPQRPVSEIAARELSNQGYDIDFEDETGAQAAAFIAAQQAADRAAQGNAPQNGERQETGTEGDRNDAQPAQNREWRDRDTNRDSGRDSGRDRDNNRDRDRDNNRDRDRNQNRTPNASTPNDPPRDRIDGENAEPRADGEGGRRETRRERWERRREERNRRFEAEGGQGPAPDGYEGDVAMTGAEPLDASGVTGTIYEPAADDAPVAAAERPARRPRTPRAEPTPVEGATDDANALPGFLTRVPTPSSAGGDDAEADAAPKRRAPRKKPIVADTED